MNGTRRKEHAEVFSGLRYILLHMLYYSTIRGTLSDMPLYEVLNLFPRWPLVFLSLLLPRPGEPPSCICGFIFFLALLANFDCFPL